MTETRSTVICGLSGGIGNQMFQYAAGRALSLRLGCSLSLDLSWFRGQDHRQYALDNFGIVGVETNLKQKEPSTRSAKLLAKLSKRYLPYRMGLPLTRERHFHFDEAFNKIKRPVYLEGYWQSPLYFGDFGNQIREDFQLLRPLSDFRQPVANHIITKTAVSVHVRRGDYVTNPVANTVHGTCSPQWYAAAIAKISEMLISPTYFVFSDDPAWARDNLPQMESAYFVEPQLDKKDFEDIHLMSLCKHHIIANSSFSWWGAWLDENPGQYVIAPLDWFANGNRDTQDLLPSEWLLV